jgi:hypothetical protein
LAEEVPLESEMELVTKVRDAEHWAQVLESSEKKLVGTVGS